VNFLLPVYYSNLSVAHKALFFEMVISSNKCVGIMLYDKTSSVLYFRTYTYAFEVLRAIHYNFQFVTVGEIQETN
jgi:hypothetical protein